MTIQNSWCKDKTNFPSKLIISMWLQSRTPQKHIYQIAEKSSQQQFEGNMTMNPVLTLWELLTKCQTATFITNSSDSAVTTYWFHQLLKVGIDIHIMTCPSSGQVIVQNLHPKFLVHFQKQWEVSVMNSTKTCKVTKRMLQPNYDKHNKKCSHKLASVTHKVSDHQLHHEWWWLAAITPHWLHQLMTVNVDNLLGI
jgi:hypothetical protein